MTDRPGSIRPAAPEGPTFAVKGARLAVANLGGLAAAAAALLGRDGGQVCAAFARHAERGGAGLPALPEAAWATLAPLGIGRTRVPAAVVLDGLLRGAEYDAEQAVAAVAACRAAAAEIGGHAGELEEGRGPLASALWGRALLVALDEWWSALADAYHMARPAVVRGDVDGAAAVLDGQRAALSEILQRLDVLAHRVAGVPPPVEHAPGAALDAATREPLPPPTSGRLAALSGAASLAADPAWDQATSSGVWDPAGALDAPMPEADPQPAEAASDAPPPAAAGSPPADDGGWGPAAGAVAAGGEVVDSAAAGGAGVAEGLAAGEAAAAAAGAAAAALAAKAGAAAVSGVKNLAHAAGAMVRDGAAPATKRRPPRGPAANRPRLPEEPRPLGGAPDPAGDGAATGPQARIALPEAPAPVVGPIPGRIVGVLKRKPPREHPFLPIVFLLLVVGGALAVLANVLGLLPVGS